MPHLLDWWLHTMGRPVYLLPLREQTYPQRVEEWWRQVPPLPAALRIHRRKPNHQDFHDLMNIVLT
jgi:hypothetical protein